MAEKARDTIGEVLEAIGGPLVPGAGGLGVVAREKPVEAMLPAELMGAAAVKGLRQLYAILDQPLDPDDLKQQRLIGDMALGVNKLLARHVEREGREDTIGRLLALIEAEKSGSEK